MQRMDIEDDGAICVCDGGTRVLLMTMAEAVNIQDFGHPGVSEAQAGMLLQEGASAFSKLGARNDPPRGAGILARVLGNHAFQPSSEVRIDRGDFRGHVVRGRAIVDLDVGAAGARAQRWSVRCQISTQEALQNEAAGFSVELCRAF